MTPFLEFISLLAVLLLLAKLAGYISVLFGQPSVLGELLAGLLVGPSLLNIMGLPFQDAHLLEEMIASIAEIGVLLLMFVAGLELNLSELAHNSRVSAYSGVLGVVFPVGLGYLVGLMFDLSSTEAFFMGLALGATSVSISAQTLMELKVLRSRVGLGLLGAAVFDDILVILLLSAFLALQSGNAGLGQVAVIFVRMVVYFALSAGFGIWVLPRLVRWVSPRPISQGVLTLAIIIMLVYGLVAEVLGGMAAITGTFLAGLMFARSSQKERIERGFNSLAYGFFVPIFFIHVGMAVNLRTLDPSAGLLLAGIVVIAIIGKLVGAGLGAKLAGFSNIESVQLGAGMISRGEVGLILGSVGLAEGLMTGAEFSALVGMVIITTLVTPPLLRFLFQYQAKKKPLVQQEPPKERIDEIEEEA